MNKAIQLIKDHGVDKAREVVEGASFGTHYRVDTGKFICCHNEDHFYFVDQVRLGVEYVRIVELKHFLESVERVESCGGLAKSKWHLDSLECSCKYGGLESVRENYKRLKKAIADYEQIFGGEHV